MKNDLIMAIDQGTTSTRAIIFDKQGQTLINSQQEFTQYYPADGWVEHDPEEIWQTTLDVCQDALKQCESTGHSVAAIGITNQRETCLLYTSDAADE